MKLGEEKGGQTCWKGSRIPKGRVRPWRRCLWSTTKKELKTERECNRSEEETTERGSQIKGYAKKRSPEK